MIRRRLRAAAAALAVTVAAGLLVVAAPAALAQSGGSVVLPGHGSTGGGGGGAPSRPKPGKPKPGKPKPGGGSKPAPVPAPPSISTGQPSQVVLTGGPTITPPTARGSAGPPGCPSRDGEPSVGWTWRGVIETRQGSLPETVSVSYRCYYRPFTLISARCGWAVSGRVSGPSSNPTIPQSTTVYPRALTAFAQGDTTEQACAASFRADYAAGLTAWGWYTLSTVGEQAACQWRRYTDGAGGTRFVGCSTPFTLPALTFPATLWCGGYRLGEHVQGLSFTLDDCKGGGGQPGTWACAGGGDARYDGVARRPSPVSPRRREGTYSDVVTVVRDRCGEWDPRPGGTPRRRRPGDAVPEGRCSRCGDAAVRR